MTTTISMMSEQRTPGPDDLRFAAEWLRQYDDSHDGGEQQALAGKVASWLDAQADAKELRAAAREHGVPVKAIRRVLAREEAKQHVRQLNDEANAAIAKTIPPQSSDDQTQDD